MNTGAAILPRCLPDKGGGSKAALFFLTLHRSRYAPARLGLSVIPPLRAAAFRHAHAHADTAEGATGGDGLGVSAVPEPQTWLLMLMGSVFVFRAGRRKA